MHAVCEGARWTGQRIARRVDDAIPTFEDFVGCWRCLLMGILLVNGRITKDGMV